MTHPALTPGRRWFRVLEALEIGPTTKAGLIDRVALPGTERKVERDKTWDALRHARTNGWARYFSRGGKYALTDAGREVLAAARAPHQTKDAA